ncbi:acetyl-CoA C-acetyltransferase [Allomyces macrogynus ATCC 38327]|uniref:acetyl-CoA C-acyltransferase n=1 Tax=Allomyces macrogynus (strain ATCC 38327) TaxID=578462 RepID=A0A0L0SAR3_ALLM3|nr:acetyl-CoA C-acetyltransferase [Allomyces macrogynus ATCC 38327]|eukprot:KNE59470.1 acetyl-CoA C-acetyltransferase [Allomyces macrogynus ATCC 38327]
MSATARVQQIAGQLQKPDIHAKSPNDVVIVSALRTPITRARKGGFKETHPEELLAAVLKATIDKTKIDPKLVEDIQVGNVLPPGGGATVARMAALYAGFPDTTALATVNRQCSSGLHAVAAIANAIATGQIDIGIGAGVESMTLGYGPLAMPQSTSDKITAFEPAADCLLPMGITSENVAEHWKIPRAKQDALAAASHAKAHAAQQQGLFNEEIVPVTITQGDKEVTITKDDGVRAGTTVEQLAKLKPAFKENGSTTAGNASQVSDGAAAVLLMRRSVAEKLRLPVLGKFVNFAAVGVPPKVMGIGPAFAIPAALKKAGITVNDVDIFEINEAFASQAVMSIEHLKIPFEKVNPKGGAIALGHPLGCTGARQIATILPELKRTGKKVGVISMCIGTGMGAAAVVVRE